MADPQAQAQAQLMQMMGSLQQQLQQLQLAVAERDDTIQQLQQRIDDAHVGAEQAAQQAQAAAAVAQQAQAAVAAPAAAAVAAAAPKVKVPYAKLALVPQTTQLNMTLDNWFTATRASLAVNAVPATEEVRVAVLAAMEGHVQAVCLEMLQAALLPNWDALKQALQLNFSQQDRKLAAATELERLTMTGDSKMALETYISKARALHLTAGSEVTELQKYRYFMRGLEKHLRELVGGLIVANGHSETFEFASNLALKIMATRQDLRFAAGSSSSSGPVPMELMAMPRNAGWRQPYKPYRQGKAGGSRADKPIKGKGRLPGKWKPRMNNQERKALMRANLCLCCKTSTDHTWRDCPKNPDNRGNA